MRRSESRELRLSKSENDKLAQLELCCRGDAPSCERSNMKSKSWSGAGRYRKHGKALARAKKALKRQRAKRGRRDPLEWEKTGAWDLY